MSFKQPAGEIKIIRNHPARRQSLDCWAGGAPEEEKFGQK